MGTLRRTLNEMSGLKAGVGWAFMKTYRESFRLTESEDEVVVQMAKRLFPDGKMPSEIAVTIEWQEQSTP